MDTRTILNMTMSMLSFYAEGDLAGLHNSPPDKDERQQPLASRQSTTASRLVVGSRIQIPASNNTLKYGVIHWIGNLAGLKGLVAGIELVG